MAGWSSVLTCLEVQLYWQNYIIISLLYPYDLNNCALEFIKFYCLLAYGILAITKFSDFVTLYVHNYIYCYIIA